MTAALLRRGALAALLVVLTGCAAEPSPPVRLEPQVVRSELRYTREYVLQPGDQIQVTVFHVPELSSTVIVRPDGFVSLPILKDVKVAGVSVPDLDQELERRYAERLNKPDVTVTVLNPRQASVFVLGDVARPGPVPARDAPNVAMAIAAAGGSLRTGSMDNVAVIRLADDGELTGTIIPRQDWGETSFFQAMAAAQLKTGDMVIVPESGRAQFVRFITDFITTPLTGVNQILSPYFEYETIRVVTKATHS